MPFTNFMEIITVKNQYFNPKDTLSCGQVFRFKEYKKGYLLISGDKICYIYSEGDNTYIETEYKDYFYNYFDLSRDYSKIYDKAVSYDIEILKLSAELGKGIRILKQDSFEMLFTFIISQNNNISRITSTVEKLCEKVGKICFSPFGNYYAFPTLDELSFLTEEDYKALGFGYRGKYFISLIKEINGGLSIENLKLLPSDKLYQALTSLLGVGDKVANCVMLFGFNKTETFPVDTWIEKVYYIDFNGKLKDRKKISKWFILEFKEYSGYIQQYLFHYKRNLEVNHEK